MGHDPLELNDQRDAPPLRILGLLTFPSPVMRAEARIVSTSRSEDLISRVGLRGEQREVESGGSLSESHLALASRTSPRATGQRPLQCFVRWHGARSGSYPRDPARLWPAHGEAARHRRLTEAAATGRAHSRHLPCPVALRRPGKRRLPGASATVQRRSHSGSIATFPDNPGAGRVRCSARAGRPRP